MYSELKEVLEYIPLKVDESGVVALHRELAGLYENARNSPSPEVTEQISNCLSRLENAQESLEPQGWDSTKIKIFEKIGASKILGNVGLHNLEEEIDQLSNDPHGVSEILNRYATEIEALRQKLQQAIDSLSLLFSDETPFPEGMKRVELVFDKKVSVENFGDMVTQASEWDKILKSLKNTIAEPSEDGHFWRIYKASPTVIVFFLPIPQAISMIEIVKNVLEIVVALLVIRSYQKSSESSPLDENGKSKILDIIKEFEKKKLDEEINKKVKVLVRGANLSGTQKAVAKVSFTHIVKKIYNFFVEGGTVNPIDKIKEDETPEQIEEYRLNFEKVEKNLKLEPSKQLLLAEFSKTEEEEFETAVSEPKPTEESKETFKDKTDNKLRKMVRKVTKKKGQKPKAVKGNLRNESEAVISKEVKTETPKK